MTSLVVVDVMGFLKTSSEMTALGFTNVKIHDIVVQALPYLAFLICFLRRTRGQRKKLRERWRGSLTHSSGVQTKGEPP